MIHVLLGPDYSLVRAAARQRALASDPEGQETVTLDGTSSTLNDVLMAVASIGFFSAGRTVIVENLIQKHGKLGAAEWTTLLTGVPQPSTLILADSSVVTLPAAVKKALPDDAEVYVGDPPRGVT